MRTSPPQVSFNAGEIDPLLRARFDYQRFQTGLAKCHGFLPLPQGGVTRAPGTTYLGQAANATGCLLISFEFADDDVMVLEFTHLKMRVWQYGSLLPGPGGAPYELATPYLSKDLPSLTWVQSADVIYLADGVNPIHRLSRFGLTNWTIEPLVLNSGPFRAQNLNEDHRVQVSGTTGSITITANGALFFPNHVGTLFQISPFGSQVNLWLSNATVNPGDLRRVGRNIYRFTGPATATTIANAQPIHEEGTVDYGGNNIWQYVCNDIGVVRITAVSSVTQATATVLRELDPSTVSVPTYRWSEGAWSDRYGYPAAIEIFDQRFVAAATPRDPRTVWFSAVGDYNDFAPSVEPDGAFAYTISGDQSQNRITGLRRGRVGLHIFALSETYSSRAESRSAVIGATNAIFTLDGSNGARRGRAIAPDGDPIFISQDGRRILASRYDFQTDGNREINLSRASQHLGDIGFRKMIWQQSPEPRAWILRASGDLAVMIYDQNEEVLGWSTHSVAGRIIDLCATRDQSGAVTEIWLVVQRTIGGTFRTTIERLDPSHHFFAAATFVLPLMDPPASPITTLSAPWLAGADVGVQVKGEAMLDYTAAVPSGGELPLDIPASFAAVGLIDPSFELETLDIQAAAPDGNAMGRNKRLSGKIAASLYETMGGTVQVIERHGPERPTQAGPVHDILPRAVGGSLGIFTGTLDLNLPSGHARGLSLRIKPLGGQTLTLLGLVPTVQEVGR